MRHILIFAAIMIVAGTYMAQLANQMTSAHADAAPGRAGRGRAVAVPVSRSARVTIARDGHGHFQTDARIDGQHIDFMVDTGASVVALTETDAARLGVLPLRGDYRATVTTANGRVKAAPDRLAGSMWAGWWCAMWTPWCCPTGRSAENLLGLSFLSRLKRFELANGQMVLQ